MYILPQLVDEKALDGSVELSLPILWLLLRESESTGPSLPGLYLLIRFGLFKFSPLSFFFYFLFFNNKFSLLSTQITGEKIYCASLQ